MIFQQSDANRKLIFNLKGFENLICECEINQEHTFFHQDCGIFSHEPLVPTLAEILITYHVKTFKYRELLEFWNELNEFCFDSFDYDACDPNTIPITFSGGSVKKPILIKSKGRMGNLIETDNNLDLSWYAVSLHFDLNNSYV